MTFIASYHYYRIFNSWVEAYTWVDGEVSLSGVPFNDAYRYMDWLLTVPLLLIEIVLVMKLDAEETKSKCVSLGSAAALMIILGYPGELVLDESNLGTRWFWWVLAMIPFMYIVYTLLIGLSDATNSESDPAVRQSIRNAQLATVISWCTYVYHLASIRLKFFYAFSLSSNFVRLCSSYPIVYLFPMLGISGSTAIVWIQIGYSIADIIAKCGVGLLVYSITNAKSIAIKSGRSEESPLVA